MSQKVQKVAHHRNGSKGNGFHANDNDTQEVSK